MSLDDCIFSFTWIERVLLTHECEGDLFLNYELQSDSCEPEMNLTAFSVFI